MKANALLALTAAATIMCVSNAQAQVSNGSFDEGGPAANNYTTANIGDSATIQGWTVVDNDGGTTDDGRNVLYIGNGGFGISTPFGVDFLDLTGTTDSSPFDGVSQTVATTLGQSYALSFDLGVNTTGGNNGGTGGSYGPPIAVEASAGSTSQLFTDLGTSGAVTAADSLWTPYSLDFTATSPTTKLSFVGETGVQFIGLDNVALTSVSGVSAAPEPSTWALMIAGVGVVGAVLRFGRRRRALATA